MSLEKQSEFTVTYSGPDAAARFEETLRGARKDELLSAVQEGARSAVQEALEVFRAGLEGMAAQTNQHRERHEAVFADLQRANAAIQADLRAVRQELAEVRTELRSARIDAGVHRDPGHAPAHGAGAPNGTASEREEHENYERSAPESGSSAAGSGNWRTRFHAGIVAAIAGTLAISAFGIYAAFAGIY